MRISHRVAALVVAVVLLVWTPAGAQSGTIEAIEVQGLYRMTQEAFKHAFGVSVGDAYEPDQIRRRFRQLWKLGLFEDIVIESETTASGGVLLVVKVKERPVLTSVTYDDAGPVTRTEIEDRLKEREIRLDPGRPIDMGAVASAEAALRDLLAEKGFLDARVDARVTRVTETTRAAHFTIIPGGKTRIRTIDFTGNELYSDRKLKHTLELTQERRWWWPWSSKNLYHPLKWDQDVSSIRKAYLDAGYLDVEIRPPVVEVREGKHDEGQSPAALEAADEPEVEAPEDEGAAGELGEIDPAQLSPEERKAFERELEREAKQRKKAAKKARKAAKKKKWVYLTVPIDEGEPYRLGSISFSGNEKFSDKNLRLLVPLVEGGLLRNNLLEAGVDNISLLYENNGHLYASVVRRIERREGEHVADVTFSIDEDDPYIVNRIEFSGNTATHDRVLRRELLLSEGELFNRTKLDISKLKVNQLGYFQAPDEPIIEPIEDENRVNITIPGQEQGRNEIQVGGGYSGVDGAFFNGVYSTRNFLGRGQILSTALQIGGRSNRYQISFQEPWFLGKPYTLGFSLFRRDVDYGASLKSTSTGGGLLLGKRFGRFSQVTLGYNWQQVESVTVLAQIDPNTGGFTTIRADNRVSSITPVYSYNTVNNPYRPSRGTSFTLSTQIAGGPLGGDTSFLKPIASYTTYRPFIGRTYLAGHAQFGLVTEWQGGSPEDASAIYGVPRFERFWLGGDTLGPRVFETRSITPLRFVVLDDLNRIAEVISDPVGRPVSDLVSGGGVPVLVEVGGDRFFLLQTEWVVPLNEQAEIAFFFDVGDALFEDQSLGFESARASAGVEMRFHLPIFPVPLRLIYGVPVRKLRGDDTSNFTFSIGRSF